MNPQLQAIQLMQQQQQAAQQLLQQQQLAELQRRKEEENKRRQELMRQKQEENQKKIEEMRKKMAAEQQACNTIIRVIQRVKVSTPETYEDMKKELEKVLEEDLEKCGSQKTRVKAESEKSLMMAKNSVDKITEHRRLMKERKEAEEKLRKEITDKTEKLLEELRALIDSAQKQCKKCRDYAQPLVEGGKSLPDEQIETSVNGVDTSCTEAEEITKKCTAFILERGPELKSLGPGSPAAMMMGGKAGEIHTVLAQLLQQIKELAIISQQVQQIARTSDGRLKKRKLARADVRSIEEIFEKYDKDADGFMSRSEAAEYAKCEFGMELPAEIIDFVWRHNVDEDEEVGLPKGNFRWLQIAVGIEREHGRDRRRQQEVADTKLQVEKLKVELQDDMKAAAQVVTDAEPVIGKVEKKAEPLQKSSKGLSSEDMVRLADEADEMILEGKSAKEGARRALLALLDSVPDRCKPDIKEFLLSELKLSEAKMGRIEMRLDRVNNLSKRWRQSAAEKAAATEALTSALEKDDAPELRAALKRGDAANCDPALLQRGRDELAKRDAAEAAKLAEEEAARKAAAEAEAARVAEAAEMERMATEDKAPEPIATAASEDAEMKQPPEEAVPADAANAEASTEASAEQAPTDATSAAGPPAGDADVTMQDAAATQPTAAVVVPPAMRPVQAPTVVAPRVVAPPPGVPKPPPAVLPAAQPAPAFLHRPDAQMTPMTQTSKAPPAAPVWGEAQPVVMPTPKPLPVASPPQVASPPAPPANMMPMDTGGRDVAMEASWALFTKELDASSTQP